MAIDYSAISEENWGNYGTRIDRYGPTLLANLYAESTHFILELLQNTEDALRRRGPDGPRSVTFELSERALTIRHFGEPFNEDDIRSICGIAESTKQLTDIGRFGIGFKSVYAWTDRPEIHSGGEDFAIKNYVHPQSADPIKRTADETVIVLPFKDGLAGARDEIVEALERDAADALRFLRKIGEIDWWIDGELSGHYQRESQQLDDEVHLVTITDEVGSEELESWLVFSDPVENGGTWAGSVEIAFAHVPEAADQPARIEPVPRSLLSAYFPTALETHLGFLVHGPYRTTPARDNVPIDDEWNINLVAQTANLLNRTLPWLRDHGYLTPAGLECMPIDEDKFDESNMFSPLFQVTKDALASEPLLPAYSSPHISARHGVLGGTDALRKLFTPEQVTELLGSREELAWLSPQITRARTPALHNYLRTTLNMLEAEDTAAIIQKLKRSFLEQQTDEWIRALYTTLKDQARMQKQPWFAALPIVRLEDGTHIEVGTETTPTAYLPTSAETSYPAVRRTVCDTADAREFLEMVGLHEPDLIDDIIDNVLPEYTAGAIAVDDEERYAGDIRRLANAYQIGSASRRQVLVRALRRTQFVRAVDAGSGERTYSRPTAVYAPTDELRRLFDGVLGVSFLDQMMRCFEETDVKAILDACGVDGTLRARKVVYNRGVSYDKWRKLQTAVQLPRSTRERHAEDWTLQGLSAFLQALPNLSEERRSEATSTLWQCLGDFAARANNASFDGVYHYFYRTEQVKRFPARFIRMLNAEQWVPTEDGRLVKPEDVAFESLGWPRNQFLEGWIRFKTIVTSPIVTLAEQADVDAGAVALIKEHGLTKSDLEEMLEQKRASVREAYAGLTSQASSPAGGVSRTFRSYVAVERSSELTSGSVDQEARMGLEERAILHILQCEPGWRRTKTGNPGFDLDQADDHGNAVKWCEVKSLSGSWEAHPVGMSDTQFEFAQEKGDAFWLYVVEYAGDPDRIRILRIQDPAERAETFTFDAGWADVAETGSGGG